MLPSFASGIFLHSFRKHRFRGGRAFLSLGILSSVRDHQHHHKHSALHRCRSPASQRLPLHSLDPHSPDFPGSVLPGIGNLVWSSAFTRLGSATDRIPPSLMSLRRTGNAELATSVPQRPHSKTSRTHDGGWPPFGFRILPSAQPALAQTLNTSVTLNHTS